MAPIVGAMWRRWRNPLFVRPGAIMRGRLPYGYTRRGATWAIDDQAAAVILRIYQDFSDPYRRPALSEVAHDLNTDELPTPRRDGTWHTSTVKYILQNRAYLGGDGYPGIVSFDLWSSVQARLSLLPMGPAR